MLSSAIIMPRADAISSKAESRVISTLWYLEFLLDNLKMEYRKNTKKTDRHLHSVRVGTVFHSFKRETFYLRHLGNNQTPPEGLPAHLRQVPGKKDTLPLLKAPLSAQLAESNQEPSKHFTLRRRTDVSLKE